MARGAAEETAVAGANAPAPGLLVRIDAWLTLNRTAALATVFLIASFVAVAALELRRDHAATIAEAEARLAAVAAVARAATAERLERITALAREAAVAAAPAQLDLARAIEPAIAGLAVVDESAALRAASGIAPPPFAERAALMGALPPGASGLMAIAAYPDDARRLIIITAAAWRGPAGRIILVIDADALAGRLPATLGTSQLNLIAQRPQAPSVLPDGAAEAANPKALPGRLTDGRPALIALAEAGWGLRIAASEPVEAALAPWYAALPLFALIIAGAGLTGAVLSIYFVRSAERGLSRRRAFDAAIEGAQRIVADERERRADAEREAAEARAAKSGFLQLMSHELRTPLNAIIGFAEIMERGMFGPVPPRYTDYVRAIRDSGEDLRKLVEDMLELARLEVREAGAPLGTLAPAQLTADCLRVVEPRARIAGVAITVETEPGITASGQRDALRKALLHVLVNAVEYSEPGTTVQIAVHREGAHAVISVADEGCGIRDEDLARVTEPFERTAEAVARGRSGAGVGLALARALIERMGGALEVARRAPRGTIVRLSLRSKTDAPPESDHA